MLKLTFTFFLSLFFLTSCQDTKKKHTIVPIIDGKDVFLNRCTACHGNNGKLGFSGAKDLTLSKFSVEQIENQVANGKGAMTPFKNILSTDEIREVAKYCKTLQLN